MPTAREQLLLMLWLKRRLLWRHYTQSLPAAVGAIVAVLVMLPGALAIALSLLAGYLRLDPPGPDHLLRAALLATYAVWILSPLFGYVLTEDYDLSKLFVYPVSLHTICLGAAAGSVLDIGVLAMLPSMLAAVVGFATSLPAFAIIVAALALFLFHTLALSQALPLAGAAALRSRRARDLLVVVAPFIAIVVYAVSVLGTRRAADWDWQWSLLLDSAPWRALGYLPPGMAAHAAAAARRGDFAPALAWTLTLAALAVATLHFAAWLMRLAYAGEGPAVAVRARARERAARAPGALARTLNLLPPVVGAVTQKELRYLSRDPALKSRLVAALYFALVIGVAFLYPRALDRAELGGAMRQVGLWAVAAVLALTQSDLVFNIFGDEGPAAAALFMFPSSRRHIIMGKNLAFFVALAGLNCALVGGLSAAAGELALWPVAALWAAELTAIAVACGNLVSVWHPVRMVTRGWLPQRRSASLSFFRAVVYLLFALLVGLLSLPALAALAGPVYWLGAPWLLLGVPASLAWVWGCYAGCLRVAERELLAREIEVAERVAKEP